MYSNVLCYGLVLIILSISTYKSKFKVVYFYNKSTRFQVFDY